MRGLVGLAERDGWRESAAATFSGLNVSTALVLLRMEIESLVRCVEKIRRPEQLMTFLRLEW
jgi:hypothetical protein